MGINNSKVELKKLRQYSRYEFKVLSYYYPNIILNLEKDIVEFNKNNIRDIILYKISRKYIHFTTPQRDIKIELKYDLSKGRVFFYNRSEDIYMYYDIYEINPLPPEYR